MTNTFDQVPVDRGAAQRPDTRRRLLDATVALIAEVGWGGVTSRAVAERAGVNNGVVHYHFGSMDGLRRAAAMHGLTAATSGALADFVAADTTGDALRGLVDALRAVDLSGPVATVSLEAMLHAPRDAEIARMLREMLAPFRQAVERKLSHDVDAGRIAAAVDVDGLAAALTALVDGLVLHALVDPALDVDRATAAIAALLHDGRGDR